MELVGQLFVKSNKYGKEQKKKARNEKRLYDLHYCVPRVGLVEPMKKTNYPKPYALPTTLM
jgi:hypothetical protein